MSTYLINRLPSSLLAWKSPYDLLYKRHPYCSTLRCFGCLCFATNTHPHKDKFAPRALKCIFLGFQTEFKAIKHTNYFPLNLMRFSFLGMLFFMKLFFLTLPLHSTLLLLLCLSRLLILPLPSIFGPHPPSLPLLLHYLPLLPLLLPCFPLLPLLFHCLHLLPLFYVTSPEFISLWFGCVTMSLTAP